MKSHIFITRDDFDHSQIHSTTNICIFTSMFSLYTNDVLIISIVLTSNTILLFPDQHIICLISTSEQKMVNPKSQNFGVSELKVSRLFSRTSNNHMELRSKINRQFYVRQTLFIPSRRNAHQCMPNRVDAKNSKLLPQNQSLRPGPIRNLEIVFTY